MTEMQARPLNLVNGFRLASIISKYIDINSINPQQDSIDFISEIVDKLSPEEYIKCVELLTGEDENTIKKEVSLNILTVFIEGLRKNQVVSLLAFYHSLNL